MADTIAKVADTISEMVPSENTMEIVEIAEESKEKFTVKKIKGSEILIGLLLLLVVIMIFYFASSSEPLLYVNKLNIKPN